MDIDDLIQRALRGERRSVARLISLVEDGGADLGAAMRTLYPHTGTAYSIGVTGAPGAGKSSLTDRLVTRMRQDNKKVGVLAIDPTSPFSGGALLGDRVRMQSHHSDPGVFIRSMAARGHLGGIAFATPQAVLVLDAAGYDDVIVETVGVGQSEVEVAATADTTVVCVAPGMGDSIQAAKAGILEVADVFIVNKADHGGAGKTEAELNGMLEAGREAVGDPAGWWPPILRAVASRGEGIEQIADALDRHHDHLVASGLLSSRRRQRAEHVICEIALAQFRERFGELGRATGHDGGSLLQTLAEKVANRDLDPYTAADQLVEALER